MTSKKNVLILFGGKSVEHDISINSAKNIYKFIDKAKFEPILIGISKQGDWYLKEDVDGNFNSGHKLSLNLSSSNKSFTYAEGQITPDVVFPVLHGTDGEDGSIQGLLQAFDIPFVGTGVLGSAVSMNKISTKRLLSETGVPVSKSKVINAADKNNISFEAVSTELNTPFMVKAANLGSSIGVYKVYNEDAFAEAMDGVFNFDYAALLEEYVEGRELECAVMGNEQPKASMPGEIVISPEYEFYTYEAKYLDPEAVKIEIPAKLDSETAERIRELSIKSYKTLHCSDFARVDVFLKANGEVLVNEINSIPGFTNSSMFPMMWGERGIEFEQLITDLIEMALERYSRSQQIIKEFN